VESGLSQGERSAVGSQRGLSIDPAARYRTKLSMLTRTPGGMAGTDSHPSDTTLPNQNLSDATLSNQNVPNKNVSDNDAARPPALRLRSGVREQGGGPGAVSLAEFPSPQRDEDRRPSGLDRLPPQDVAAEQCVLGSMLLSKDAIADVVELLMGNDFYRPAHETVYDAIIDLYGRGEPADAVTVSAELSRRNELTRIGGASYLHTLIASVPSAANAGYYAEIVHEKATLRRLVGAGTKIVQTRLRRRGRRRLDRRRRAGRDLPGEREACVRGLHAALRHHGGDARRDRGGQLAGWASSSVCRPGSPISTA